MAIICLPTALIGLLLSLNTVNIAWVSPLANTTLYRPIPTINRAPEPNVYGMNETFEQPWLDSNRTNNFTENIYYDKSYPFDLFQLLNSEDYGSDDNYFDSANREIEKHFYNNLSQYNITPYVNKSLNKSKTLQHSPYRNSLMTFDMYHPNQILTVNNSNTYDPYHANQSQTANNSHTFDLPSNHTQSTNDNILFETPAEFIPSTQVCMATSLLQGSFHLISNFSLSLVALDRYLALRKPKLAAKVSEHGFSIILSVWVLSIGLSVPRMLFAANPSLPNCDKHLFPEAETTKRLYFVGLVLVGHWLPCVVVVCFHAAVATALKNTTKKRDTIRMNDKPKQVRRSSNSYF